MSHAEFPMPVGDEYHNWQSDREGRPMPVQPRPTQLPPLFPHLTRNEQPPAYNDANEQSQYGYNRMQSHSLNSYNHIASQPPLPSQHNKNFSLAFLAHQQSETSQMTTATTTTAAMYPLRLSNTAQNLVILFF